MDDIQSSNINYLRLSQILFNIHKRLDEIFYELSILYLKLTIGYDLRERLRGLSTDLAARMVARLDLDLAVFEMDQRDLERVRYILLNHKRSYEEELLELQIFIRQRILSIENE